MNELDQAQGPACSETLDRFKPLKVTSLGGGPIAQLSVNSFHTQQGLLGSIQSVPEEFDAAEI